MKTLILQIRIPQGGDIPPIKPEESTPHIVQALEKEMSGYILNRLKKGVAKPGIVLRFSLEWIGIDDLSI